ncbi:allantoicase [Motilibacter rhizosphaerae]|uniref:Probable allantoicase n=1 Tax=Motilibacter rhizosphaerae TaxID=598652 RepID=A0A4Q7NXF8_9ACTN|nr:allantoicase [Motilibacter rhizosphaerae]RZS91680.1 allantoicase [Motilibacter rhizosphaerae]
MSTDPRLDAYPDLTGARFGGTVIAVSDEFFGPAERMLQPDRPVSRRGTYDEHGQWMDGWETRRRRGERRYDGAADWAVIRLGAPGVPTVVVVDTGWFSGNQMESAALDGTWLPGNPSPSEVLAAEWEELLPPQPLEPDALHALPVPVSRTVTHVRLRAAPDGGIARLRVHGPALPDPRLADGLTVDLAAAEWGGIVPSCSDMHFGRRANLVAPGEARSMGEGWETRRRRGPGADWVRLTLATECTLRQVILDTRHFKGNAPESAELSGRSSREEWVPLVPPTPLQPDQRHHLAVDSAEPVRELLLTVHPDGGVARLRTAAVPTAAGRREWAERWLDALPEAALRRELTAVCGSSRWVEDVLSRRPFLDALPSVAEEVWNTLPDRDRLEALLAHPRIGEKPRAGSQERREQAGADGADTAVLAEIATGNAAYEERFGFTYVVRASGRTADEMLALLRQRLDNDPETELEVASAQQLEILLLRVRRLLEGP